MYLLSTELVKATQKWPEADRIDMVIEECSELIVAIQHYKRNRVGTEEVIEEMTDVRIMLDQLETILIGNNQYASDMFKLMEEHKLNRLKGEPNETSN